MKSKAMFFAHADGTYRYWVRKVSGQTEIKLQIAKPNLQAFLATLAGKRATDDVDLLTIGGGWYSITMRDKSALSTLLMNVGIDSADLAMPWLRALNQHFLRPVQQVPFEVTYVKRVTPPPCDHRKLQSLVQKFSGSRK